MDVKRGSLIVFEGGEGAGKTTQVKHLAAHLREFGIHVIETREPGGTPVAEAIREVVVNGRTDKMSQTTEALLMYAARNDHIEKVIKPALDAGHWVVCDRFYLSTEAYQQSPSTKGLLYELHDNIVIGWGVDPNYWIFLDIDPTIGLMRAARRTDKSRFEAKDIEYHNEIREFFLSAQIERDYESLLVNTARLGEDQVREIITKSVDLHFDLTTADEE